MEKFALEQGPKQKVIMDSLLMEIERLHKQKCAYCSGFGHSKSNCPTDYKLSQLSMGVREQKVAV